MRASMIPRSATSFHASYSVRILLFFTAKELGGHPESGRYPTTILEASAQAAFFLNSASPPVRLAALAPPKSQRQIFFFAGTASGSILWQVASAVLYFAREDYDSRRNLAALPDRIQHMVDDDAFRIEIRALFCGEPILKMARGRMLRAQGGDGFSPSAAVISRGLSITSSVMCKLAETPVPRPCPSAIKTLAQFPGRIFSGPTVRHASSGVSAARQHFIGGAGPNAGRGGSWEFDTWFAPHVF